MTLSHTLNNAYDPQSFRALGHRLVDELAEHLESVHSQQQAAIPYQDPAAQLAYWEQELRENQGGDPLHFFQKVLSRSVQLHHPRYMGHQVCPPAPLAALSSLLDGLLNNGMAVYEMGMASTAIERVVLKEVVKGMGLGASAGGVLTSGGTLANLTALLAARSAKAPSPVWSDGSGTPLALMVSEEAHYCVDRAARIMGWGEKGIIKIPVDEQYRMRTDLLPAYLAEAESKGTKVIAVVGSACTTSTGSFDDLQALADFCEGRDLWLHVDGAHGAALAFSKQHRGLLAGLERADSVTMDFHKMLLAPVLATALIFREERQSYHTFSQQAQYLWEGQSEQEWYNLAKRTFECTKFMMGIKVYSLLRTYGTKLWQEYLDRVVAHGKALSRLIRQHPDFELALEPSCNIVCFRYRPSSAEEQELNALNSGVRQRLLEEGRFYIVQTYLRSSLYLRVTLANPFTSEDDLLALLQTVEEQAHSFSAG